MKKSLIALFLFVTLAFILVGCTNSEDIVFYNKSQRIYHTTATCSNIDATSNLFPCYYGDLHSDFDTPCYKCAQSSFWLLFLSVTVSMYAGFFLIAFFFLRKKHHAYLVYIALALLTLTVTLSVFVGYEHIFFPIGIASIFVVITLIGISMALNFKKSLAQTAQTVLYEKHPNYTEEHKKILISQCIASLKLVPYKYSKKNTNQQNAIVENMKTTCDNMFREDFSSAGNKQTVPLVNIPIPDTVKKPIEQINDSENMSPIDILTANIENVQDDESPVINDECQFSNFTQKTVEIDDGKKNDKKKDFKNFFDDF